MGRVFVGGIMSRRVSALSMLAFALLAASSVLAQKTLTSTEAKAHIGEQATVCGKVVSTRWAESSRGGPTFLNFDQPYPDQVFTLVIWGNDRSKFDNPEATYRGKRVCVNGKISAFKGVPEVIANDPSQIKVQ
jgi:DNA/RNA endonuclease YhcR with UshA esterase domain